MRVVAFVAAVGIGLLPGCAGVPRNADPVALQQQVAATERAFARTMAERDHAAFTAFLAEDAIFVSEPKTLRGKAEVAAAWKRFYDRPAAPFSWTSGQVEVLGRRHAGAQHGSRVRPRRQAGRDVHVHLAAGSARRLAHRVRQGQRRLRLREAVRRRGTGQRPAPPGGGIRGGPASAASPRQRSMFIATIVITLVPS